MDFYDFAVGPLLWISFLVFLIGSLLRVVLFFYVSLQKDKAIYRYFSWKYVLATFGRWLFPFNKDVAKNPVYTILAYVFHICLLVVPIWFSGHISLWEESRLEWSWSSIPDSLADWMTIILLGIVIFFLLRRIISPETASVLSATT